MTKPIHIKNIPLTKKNYIMMDSKRRFKKIVWNFHIDFILNVINDFCYVSIVLKERNGG